MPFFERKRHFYFRGENISPVGIDTQAIKGYIWDVNKQEPHGKGKQTMANILNRITTIQEFNKKISDYESHIKMMIGKPGKPMPLRVMIVSGDKGVGKTFRAEKILGSQKHRRFKIFNGEISAVDFYKLLWQYNDGIIVLDDVNKLLQDAGAGASLLKACTDSTGTGPNRVRKLHWSKMNRDCIHVDRFDPKSNKEIENKMQEIASKNKRLAIAHENGITFPDAFFFTGAVIILTNKPLEIVDKYTEGALSNRGYHQEILFNVDGAVELIKSIAPHMKFYGDTELQAKNVNKALKFLTTENHIKMFKKHNLLPTIRTLGKLATECEWGHVLDEDILLSNIESPAY